MLIDVAATAPVELLGPRAVTQAPTLSAEAEADSSWVAVVEEATVTVMSVVGGCVVVVVDEVVEPGRKRPVLRSTPCTTKPELDVDVTFPTAVAS